MRDRVVMVSKCIVGLFCGTHFQHGGKFVPKTIPRCTLTTILTRTTVQPQNREYAYLEIVRQLGPACIPRVHGDECGTCWV